MFRQQNGLVDPKEGHFSIGRSKVTKIKTDIKKNFYAYALLFFEIYNN